MASPGSRADTLFEQAAGLADTAARRAFLDQQCASDADLRAAVEARLTQHSRGDEYLGGSLSGFAPSGTRDPLAPHPPHGQGGGPTPVVGTTHSAADFAMPDVVGAVFGGKYRLVEPIAEGGMGSVWKAEQTEPIRRLVALKLIRGVPDSSQVLARFAAEQQALAMMDHPNIARVFDVGTTAGGRPFFVMELVPGVPITPYCNEHRLTVRQRLELFIPVCQALQHAHQKGIIHRDIKPNNVLVAEYEGRATPKVIDFGVAKATGAQQPGLTLATTAGMVVGTPLYMSPEQARPDRTDVDTRSDIYALGVLLYELLTGTTPVAPDLVATVPLAELLRVVCEVDPPPPSERVVAAETWSTVAEERKASPWDLPGQLRGELDWIVMKALEKDRSRRYESASALARDLERYLADDVVEARPPSARYRMMKLLRRYRGVVAAVAALVVALAAGIVGTTWGLLAAREAAARERQALAAERQQAQLAEARRLQAEASAERALTEKRIAEAVRTFLQVDLLGQASAEFQADTNALTGGGAKANITVRELLDRAAARLTQSHLAQRFPDQLEVRASILRTVGNAYVAIGEYGRGAALLERSTDLFGSDLSPDHLETLATERELAIAKRFAGKTQAALTQLQTVLDKQLRVLGREHPQTLITRRQLALAFHAAGDQRRALAILEEIRTDARDSRSLERYYALHSLALVYLEMNQVAEAESLFMEVCDALGRLLGPAHPSVLSAKSSVARAHQASGKLAAAVALLEAVAAAQLDQLGADHPERLSTLNNLASVFQVQGDVERATQLYAEALRGCTARLGADHPKTLTNMNNLASAYLAKGQLEAALPLFQQAAAGVEKLGYQHVHSVKIIGNACMCLEQLGQFTAAESWRRKLLQIVCEQHGADSVPLALEQTLLAVNLLAQKRGAQAEPILREALVPLQRDMPDSWIVCNTKSLLGGALLQQQRYAEAKPLLVAGYEGIKARLDTIPPPARARAIEALERLVQLHEAENHAADAARCRAELDELKRTLAPAKR